MIEMTMTTAPMARPSDQELKALARRVRGHVLRMTAGGGCFVGASLSCTDLLVHLYRRVLRVSPALRLDPDRDVLLLSKGHDVPALYGLLAELGYFPVERLEGHLSTGDDLYWHPNRAIPGIEFHSGSLGHLLSVGIGFAMDARLRSSPARTVVVLGDGELDEGSIWEAALVASGQGLDQLVAVIDRNHLQANGLTERIMPLEPIEAKWRAFGWATVRVDGHDFRALDGATGRLPLERGRPTAIVADTVRGKGVPSLEGRVDRWFAAFGPEEIEALLAELDGGPDATLVSPGLVVR